MDIETEINRQMVILTSDVNELIPKEELRIKLKESIRSCTPLRVKMGIDPTAPDVHLGHMVVYKKMRQFQELGHRAVLIIGDYTAQIGDPTGRNAERPPLTEKDVGKNSLSYTEQIFKIVDRENTEVHFQSSWFSKVSLQEVISSASAFSVAHMLTHETFRKRLEQGNRLSLHEMMYPLLQAWDSVFINADVEIGGSDQKFNILCGRDLQKEKKLEPQVVLLMPILKGTDGRKMSKSFGNHIPVLSSPREKFGKIMSLSDDLILDFFTYTTSRTEEEVDLIRKRLQKENPRDLKMELAKDIISIYHSRDEARLCEEEFINIFSRKGLPDEIPQYVLKEKNMTLTAALKDAGIINSVSEGKRLIVQGGVKIDDIKIMNPDFILNGSDPVIIKAGKRRFLKIFPK